MEWAAQRVTLKEFFAISTFHSSALFSIPRSTILTCTLVEQALRDQDTFEGEPSNLLPPERKLITSWAPWPVLPILIFQVNPNPAPAPQWGSPCEAQPCRRSTHRECPDDRRQGRSQRLTQSNSLPPEYYTLWGQERIGNKVRPAFSLLLARWLFGFINWMPGFSCSLFMWSSRSWVFSLSVSFSTSILLIPKCRNTSQTSNLIPKDPVKDEENLIHYSKS